MSTPAPAVTERIRLKLAALRPESVEIHDDSAAHAGHAGARAGGGHYSLVIVSGAFTGQPAQQRHRMVYAALGDMMTRDIHALAIRAFAPDEI